ncbi:MAG: hypothetical protein Q9182_001807 [Xanthomendoza sp. 2 TL-2023]
MSGQQHIPSAGHGFFTYDDHSPQRPTVNEGNDQVHQQAQQPLGQDTPTASTPVGDEPRPVHAADSENDLSEKEEDELLDLEHKATKADRTVERLQRKLIKAQADAQQIHLRVDEARRRIELARKRSHVQATSSLPPSIQPQGVTVGPTQLNQSELLPCSIAPTGYGRSTFVPYATVPINGKRDTAHRDDGDIDSNQETRRVRPRTEPARTEGFHQAVAHLNKLSQCKGGPGSRRHEHPYTQMRPSGPSSRNGPRSLSSHAQYPHQTPISTVAPQKASYVAEKPHNDPIQASRNDIVVDDAEGTGKVDGQSSTTNLQKVTQYDAQGHNLEGSLGDPMGLGSKVFAYGTVQPGSPRQSPTNPHRIGVKRRIPTEDPLGAPDWEDDDGKLTVKRQIKRQKLLASGKDIPKDSEKEKGKIHQDIEGNLFVELNGKWEPAVYHHERRHGLLAREAQKGLYSQGMHPDDKTAFHEDYADIDMRVRERRPHLLYQWDPPQKEPRYNHPGYMRDSADNKLLLDLNGHVILDWPELPKTISGQVEGLWLEYWWRLNRHISTENMLARCPRMTQKGPKTQNRPLPGISAYGNRRERDRLLIGTRAWEEKEGSSLIKSRMKEVMPNRVLAELAQHGTTRTWRDLKNNEINAICHVNKGQGTAQARAGDRKLSQEEKAGVDQKKDPMLEKVFSSLLQEKLEQDVQDQATGYIGARNTGSLNMDAPAETTHHGAGIDPGQNHLHLLQHAEQDYGAENDFAMPGEFFNGNEPTFFQVQEQEQMLDSLTYASQIANLAPPNVQTGFDGLGHEQAGFRHVSSPRDENANGAAREHNITGQPFREPTSETSSRSCVRNTIENPMEEQHGRLQDPIVTREPRIEVDPLLQELSSVAHWNLEYDIRASAQTTHNTDLSAPPMYDVATGSEEQQNLVALSEYWAQQRQHILSEHPLGPQFPEMGGIESGSGQLNVHEAVQNGGNTAGFDNCDVLITGILNNPAFAGSGEQQTAMSGEQASPSQHRGSGGNPIEFTAHDQILAGTTANPEVTLQEREATTTSPGTGAPAFMSFVEDYDQSSSQGHGPVDGNGTLDFNDFLNLYFSRMPSGATTTDVTTMSSGRAPTSNVVTGAANTHEDVGTTASNLPDNTTQNSRTDTEDPQSQARLRQNGIEAQDFAHHRGLSPSSIPVDPRGMNDEELDALLEQYA